MPFDLPALEARVQAQREEIAEPLDLGVPVIEVDTSDGYEPTIDTLVTLIGDSRS